MKGLRLGATVLSVVIVLIGIIGYIVILGGENKMVIDEVATHDDATAGFLINFSIFLTAAAFCIALVFGLIQLATNLKRNKNVLIGLGIFIVYLLIMSGIYGGDMPAGIESPGTDTAVLQESWSSTSSSLMSAIWLIVIAFGMALVWGVMNMVKKMK